MASLDTPALGTAVAGLVAVATGVEAVSTAFVVGVVVMVAAGCGVGVGVAPDKS
jgi:hypothetical protein